MISRFLIFIWLLIGLLLAGFPLEAQQSAKLPRIGYVSGTGSLSDPGPYFKALRQGLRDLGHIDGKNIVIEFRGAEGKPTRIPSLVAELVQLKAMCLSVEISQQPVQPSKQPRRSLSLC